ncbi:GNAT family N-acetyltransferase [Plantactinospora solaniradicis]|uniref:GNAT family N-acetyltransferase n=1 Tax=Plantactinospora solaniradicis TaxID=1723736 RepID=A0ABW1KHH5_9ACTN
MPGMAVQLRPVQRQDVPRLADLLAQLGYPADEAAVHERLDYWLDDPSSWLVGAYDDGDLIGVAGLHILPMLEVTGKLGRLLALVVDDRYRGRSVGQSLVTAAEEQARAAGCVQMEITSSRYRTRTHEFYQRLGYEDRCATKARFVKGLAIG